MADSTRFNHLILQEALPASQSLALPEQLWHRSLQPGERRCADVIHISKRHQVLSYGTLHNACHNLFRKVLRDELLAYHAVLWQGVCSWPGFLLTDMSWVMQMGGQQSKHFAQFCHASLLPCCREFEGNEA